MFLIIMSCQNIKQFIITENAIYMRVEGITEKTVKTVQKMALMELNANGFEQEVVWL